MGNLHNNVAWGMLQNNNNIELYMHINYEPYPFKSIYICYYQHIYLVFYLCLFLCLSHSHSLSSFSFSSLVLFSIIYLSFTHFLSPSDYLNTISIQYIFNIHSTHLSSYPYTWSSSRSITNCCSILFYLFISLFYLLFLILFYFFIPF